MVLNIFYSVVLFAGLSFVSKQQPSQKSPDKDKFHVVKVTSDIPSNIYLDGAFKGKTKDQLPVQIFLKKGEFTLRAVALNSPRNFKEQKIKITEVGTESSQTFLLKEEIESTRKKALQAGKAHSMDKIDTSQVKLQRVLPPKDPK